MIVSVIFRVLFRSYLTQQKALLEPRDSEATPSIKPANWEYNSNLLYVDTDIVVPHRTYVKPVFIDAPGPSRSAAPATGTSRAPLGAWCPACESRRRSSKDTGTPSSGIYILTNSKFAVYLTIRVPKQCRLPCLSLPDIAYMDKS